MLTVTYPRHETIFVRGANFYIRRIHLPQRSASSQMQRDNKHARATYSIINRVHFNLQLEPTYIYIYISHIYYSQSSRRSKNN